LQTVTRELSIESARVRSGDTSRAQLLAHYGHLRPGTYDILSRRYDEAFEEYFPSGREPAKVAVRGEPSGAFALTAVEERAVRAFLEEEGLGVSPAQLLVFLRTAIEGRERAKLLFTRNVSDSFVLLEKLGEQCGLQRSDLSWLNIRTVLELYATLDALDLREIFENDIERNRRAFERTAHVRLPDLITSPDDVWHFHPHTARPSFIGRARLVADVVHGNGLETRELGGRIVCIEAADPGFDWVFTRGIAGLITTYGGTNSHMAVRAHELGIPAVVGCGAANAAEWFRAHRLELDCEAQIVRVVS
jgi:glutamine kinase